jgi:RNA polymerase sigma-70 factor (ECF subfamily)
MLAIWLRADTFAMRSKVSTWILGIALRRGLKAVERSDRLTVFALDETEMEEFSLGPEERASRKELRACLDLAMKALSPEHRAVIELTYFEGYSYREIASIVGCPADTVKTRMFHARRRLKALLADQREDAA